jgi:hypothetical protein
VTQRLTSLGFLISLTLIAGLAGLAWDRSREMNDAAASARHTRDVIDLALQTKLEPTPALIAELRRLTADNPNQQARIAQIELADRARTLEVLDALTAEERRLLAERTQKRLEAVRDFERFGFAGAVLAFLAVALSAWRLTRENRMRRATEQELRAANRFLDSVVENIPNMIFVKEASTLRFSRINAAGE